MKHTPGKLFVANAPDTDRRTDIRIEFPGHPPGISVARITCFGADAVHRSAEANAERIAACWNACEGMENPMSFEVVRQRIKAAIATADREACDECPDPMGDAVEMLRNLSLHL